MADDKRKEVKDRDLEQASGGRDIDRIGDGSGVSLDFDQDDVTVGTRPAGQRIDGEG